MVIINWNFGAQVPRCTMCQLEAYVNNDLGCHNNGKDLYLGNYHLNHQSSDQTRDSTEVLLMWILS